MYPSYAVFAYNSKERSRSTLSIRVTRTIFFPSTGEKVKAWQVLWKGLGDAGVTTEINERCLVRPFCG